MIYINADGKVQKIGYQTENNRTQVAFDLADIIAEFPGGLATLIIQRPGDDEGMAYPATSVEMDGTNLVWTVSAYDIEIRGKLKAQVIYSVDDVIAKTKIYHFVVDKSLIASQTPPSGWQDWMITLLEAAAQTQAAVNSYDEMTASATQLEAGETPTAQIDHSGDHPVLNLGIPKQYIANAEIDDTAGVGDTTKVWSASKSATENENLKSAVNVLEPAATDADVGKTLVVKTVSEGKVTEYEFGKTGAGLYDLPSDQSIWDLGGFDTSGRFTKIAGRIRTREYIDKDIQEINVSSGYKFALSVWEDGTYKGRVNGDSFSKTSVYTWFTERTPLGKYNGYDLKIELAKTEGTDISKADTSNIFFAYSSDKMLKNNQVPADAKATGDAIQFNAQKALKNIPHETITQTVSTNGKSYWGATNNVASLVTTTSANDRASSVRIYPTDEITLTLTTSSRVPFMITDGAYNVLFAYEWWEATNDTQAQSFHFYAPENSVYLLINSYASTNTVSVSIVRYYETAKNTDMEQAQTDISGIQTSLSTKFIDTSSTHNILDYRPFLEGEISSTTGEFTPVSSPATYKYVASGFIPVNAGKTYTLNRLNGEILGSPCQGYYYYDSDKTYISGETGNNATYWSRFEIPDGVRYIRLFFYIGQGSASYESISEYIKATFGLYEYGSNRFLDQFEPVMALAPEYRSDFFDIRLLQGKTIAVLGDSIGTRQGYNDPEILITDDDVGVELSAYVTYNDVSSGLTIAGTTYTTEDIGTEVTFIPTENDVGKSIGVPLNHGTANGVRWFQILCAKLGMTAVNASWSGTTMVSAESRSQSSKMYYASCAWYEPTLRRCGIRTPGTMTRTAPDYIFIHRGVNDFSREHAGTLTVLTDDLFASHDYEMPQDDQVTVENATKYGFKEAYSMTIQKLRDRYPSAKIICCTLTPFRRHNETHFPPDNGYYSLPQFNEAIREVADFYGCPVCDFAKAYSYEQLSIYTGDNTHPNDFGHYAMYGIALDCLTRNMKFE